MVETAINRIQGDNYCCVFTGERKLINKIKEYETLFPNEVKIKFINEDGSIVAYVPSNWFRFVKPPTKRNYTEEQRKAMGERMKKARDNKRYKEE